MSELIMALWYSFISSWFNISLLINIIIYLFFIFNYVKKGNIKRFRIGTVITFGILFLVIVIGAFLGYQVRFDIQDILYLTTFSIYVFTFGISFIPTNCFNKISKYILFSILSGIFFFSFDKINPELLLSVSISLYIFSLFIFNVRKNKPLIRRTSCLLFINLLIYSILRIPNFNISIISFTKICYLIYIFILLITFCFTFISDQENIQNNEEKVLNFFDEREKDLERFIKLLNSSNLGLIGIQSIWGNGKSFLIKLLAQKYGHEYQLITISVLSLKVDEIENLILTEIFNILEQNKIFSSSSNKLKSIFSQSFFHNLGDTFIEKKSYSELIIQLKKDVDSLNKKIIITFEDIDRIRNEECIYKIFYLAEELTSKKIKIVFQYDEKKLLEVLQLKNKEYLEKYIPFTMQLTQIPFSTLLVKELELNNTYDNLQFSDFDYLLSQFTLPAFAVIDFSDFSIIPCNYLLSDSLQIRKIEVFLKETNEYLSNKSLRKYKNILITLFFIKHFDSEFYNVLLSETSYFELLIIRLDDNFISLIETFKTNAGNIKEKLSIKDNEKRFIYSLLFGFNFDELIKTNKLNNLNMELIKEKNFKIDRIIKYLIFTGKEITTSQEELCNAVSTIFKSDKTKTSMEEDLRNLLRDYKLSDNHIFEDTYSNKYAELFKASDIYINDIVIYEKIISFYFDYINKEYDGNIQNDIVATLTNVNINNDVLLFKILKEFSKLKVIYNISAYPDYKNFISKIIEKVVEKNYLSKTKKKMSDIGNNEWNREALELLLFYQGILDKDLRKFNNSKAKEIADCLKKFIDKNIEIFNEKDEEEPPEYDDERYDYDNKYEYLHSQGYSSESINEELNNDFDKGTISLNDYRDNIK